MKFKVTAFADEYSPELGRQIEGLHKNGIGFMEIRGVDGKNVSSLTPAEAKETARRLADGGIAVSTVGSPIGKTGVRDDFGPHLETFRRTVETAHLLGTDKIRMFSFFIPSGEDPAKWRGCVMERLSALLDIAEREKIVLCHENEKAIYGDSPERCLDINEYFGGKIKCIFDPANFINCGYKPYPDAFRLLGDKIFYMHIKDACADNTIVPAGYGIGGVADILSELARRDGEMFLSVEPHLKVFEGFKSLEGEQTTKIADTYATNEEAFGAAAGALSDILAKL